VALEDIKINKMKIATPTQKLTTNYKTIYIDVWNFKG